MADKILLFDGGTCGMRVGDRLTFCNVRMTRKERFAAWLRRPWRFPPKLGERTSTVVAVTNGEIDLEDLQKLESQ